jgi:tyrosine decarboxylase/aspartate 1-decarboxylase
LDELAVDTPYLESREQATLTGTRSGAGVASAAAATRELWPDGYRRQHRRARANAEWLADRLRERGYRVDDPGVGVLAATVDAETFESLREAGWRVASTADGDLRVVFGPHVTRDVLESFVADLDRVGTPASANAST